MSATSYTAHTNDPTNKPTTYHCAHHHLKAASTTSQMILLPSQPPRSLPPVIPTPSSHTIRPQAPPPTSPQTLLFYHQLLLLLHPITYGHIGTTWFLHIHQLQLHVTNSLSLMTTIMINQLQGPPHHCGNQYAFSTLACLVTLPTHDGRATSCSRPFTMSYSLRHQTGNQFTVDRTHHQNQRNLLRSHPSHHQTNHHTISETPTPTSKTSGCQQ